MIRLSYEPLTCEAGEEVDKLRNLEAELDVVSLEVVNHGLHGGEPAYTARNLDMVMVSITTSTNTLTLVTVMKMAGAPPPPGPASRVCSWLSRNRCLPDIPNIVF